MWKIIMNNEHSDHTLLTYFGTASDNLYPYSDNAELGFHELINKQQLESLVVLRQNHGTQTRLISQADDLQRPLDFFTSEGDILLTQQKNVALGVVTGDCVPVLIHDPVNQAIAAVHAGWRGTSRGVVERALEQMKQHCGSAPAHCTVQIGPAAQSCCYEVGPEFRDVLGSGAVDDRVLVQRQDRWYCDVARLNALQLQRAGVPQEAIALSPICTICDHRYFSHRRQKEAAGRQISYIVLS